MQMKKPVAEYILYFPNFHLALSHFLDLKNYELGHLTVDLLPGGHLCVDHYRPHLHPCHANAGQC